MALICGLSITSKILGEVAPSVKCVTFCGTRPRRGILAIYSVRLTRGFCSGLESGAPLGVTTYATNLRLSYLDRMAR